MADTRLIVFETLLAIEKDSAAGKHLVKYVLDKYAYLTKTERAFIKCLCEGVIERKITIDYILAEFSSIPPKKMKPPIRTLCRMGVYQIMYMDSVPDHAACGECVKIAKKKGLSGLSGFVNGVLRKVAINRDDIKYPDAKTEPIRYLSVKYSCPDNIVKLFLEENGYEICEHILTKSLQPRSLYIRVNTHLISTDELAEHLRADNVTVSRFEGIDCAIKVDGVDSVANLWGYEQGYFTVQDPASMLVCLIAGIKPGDRVLDICAAPGGKSTHAADMAYPDVTVTACDLSERKVSLIKDNAGRLRLDNIETCVCDATIMNERFVNSADVVLADVPCSGLGVIGRKNDIKYNVSDQILNELPDVQKRILDNAAKYVKIGGTLVFSTCTIHKAENEDNCRYIREVLGLTPVPFDDMLPEHMRTDSARDGYLTLFNGEYDTDGFFIAKFTRR